MEKYFFIYKGSIQFLNIRACPYALMMENWVLKRWKIIFTPTDLLLEQKGMPLYSENGCISNEKKITRTEGHTLIFELWATLPIFRI